MATQITFAFANNTPWKRNYQMTHNGVPVVLTGAVLHMQFRSTPLSDEVAIDLSTTNGLLAIVDGDNGVWGFTVPLARSSQVPAETYNHDMVVTTAGGDVYRPYEGTAIVEQGVTRGAAPWQT